MDNSSNNFRIGAEWEAHASVWMSWPHDLTTFPPGHIENVEKIYLEIIRHLSPSETIMLLVLNEEMRKKVSIYLEEKKIDPSRVIFHIVDYADVWLRDYGPMFVVNPNEKKIAWVKWQYDAYSKKFPALLKDNDVFYKLADKIDYPMKESSMVLEGGSIEQNGQGTILTTEQCLLDSGRNPGLTKAQIEENLKTFLGASNIVWLKRGLINDHTDGHIDDIAKFVSKDTILVAYEEDEKEENHKILKKNFEDLENARSEDGAPFRLIKLQVPHLKYDLDKPFEAGEKAPASYTNFYIGNEVILVPVYNDPNDTKALETIKGCFPDRRVIGIDCRDLIYGGGSIHCMTREQPAPR